MTFKMKVADIFRMGKITIFAGDLYTDIKIITETKCYISVDGIIIGEVMILGEMQIGKPERDLVTKSPLTLTRETVRNHEVWLIGGAENKNHPIQLDL